MPAVEATRHSLSAPAVAKEMCLLPAGAPEEGLLLVDVPEEDLLPLSAPETGFLLTVVPEVRLTPTMDVFGPALPSKMLKHRDALAHRWMNECALEGGIDLSPLQPRADAEFGAARYVTEHEVPVVSAGLESRRVGAPLEWGLGQEEWGGGGGRVIESLEDIPGGKDEEDEGEDDYVEEEDDEQVMGYYPTVPIENADFSAMHHTADEQCPPRTNNVPASALHGHMPLENGTEWESGERHLVPHPQPLADDAASHANDMAPLHPHPEHDCSDDENEANSSDGLLKHLGRAQRREAALRYVFSLEVDGLSEGSATSDASQATASTSVAGVGCGGGRGDCLASGGNTDAPRRYGQVAAAAAAAASATVSEHASCPRGAGKEATKEGDAANGMEVRWAAGWVGRAGAQRGRGRAAAQGHGTGAPAGARGARKRWTAALTRWGVRARSCAA